MLLAGSCQIEAGALVTSPNAAKIWRALFGLIEITTYDADD